MGDTLCEVIVSAGDKEYWSEGNFFQELLKQLPVYVFWKDRESVYLGCNDSFAVSVGFSSAEEIIGKTDYDLPTTKEESDAFRADDNEVMTKKVAKINIEEKQTFTDGRVVHLLTSKVPLLNKKNQVVGVLGIYSDITEKKVAQEETERMLENYERFVSNQEHDMLTPYTGLVDASELLVEIIQEEGGSPEVESLSKHIHLSGQGLLSYQKSLLDSIYLFNNETELYNRRFEFRTYMQSICDMFLCSLKEKSLELSLTIDKNIPDFLQGDNFRLRSCLVRLLSNAVKYTEEGGIKISCHEKSTQEKNEVLLDIQVEDTGIGIEEDKLDVIFEPFTRLTPSNIGKYEGRGVGLAFVKKMMDELGGEIEVISEVEKGSVFRLLLPMKKSLAQDPAPKPTGSMN